ESLSSALSRGARIYAEIIGYGATADAYHVTSPDLTGSGAARSMKMALKQAKINPGDVGYINAHGTSTRINDAMETLAIKKIFHDSADKIFISSTKSMTGHLLGAAGGIELIASALALNKKILPPTINLDNLDPECDLNYIANEAVEADIDIAMSNSFGFGGHNAAIIIRKWAG
ncbi:MAG TPA: beta-ketoacyl-[acyl-carrier-protein] synthase II, partial [Actinobacteria bacterium]|nr:beta-ketoacyl-[acyl-carrier-protein] synthase II [Actinomycetes bacterium]HEX21411.1 beta-ketoacyl-[acyl-carrier-protein] synthase II [Actinomycetota bacterium]